MGALEPGYEESCRLGIPERRLWEDGADGDRWAARQDGGDNSGEKLGEGERGRSRDKGGEDRLTPYYTPPHSPGTPKAPAFEGRLNGFDDMRNENGIPPSPKTARPDSSSPAPGFPPFLPRVDVVASDSSSNGDISYPASPSHAEFPRSPMAMSFGMDPPPTALGDSFPHHSDFDHDPRSDDTDGPPTTEDPHPPFTVSIILPQFLFLGPEPSAEDHLQMLKDHGVKRILNLAIECDENDHGLALAQTFDKYTKIAMRDHVEEEGVVGKAGKSRSVTAIIAYLIHANHWTLSKAYAFVLERRKGISPNIGFVSELMTFEEEELGGKSIGVQPSAPGGQQGIARWSYSGIAAPVFTTAGPVSALEPIVNGLGGEGDAGPMSAGTLLVGSVRAEVGQDMEIKDAQGRWRHARRAPVDEQTLQPMRRVSKAGLESSAYGYGVS
ncbi:Dual specificity protein [Salix suchowensis]|nr:Dual specificity protein [Salix suchowensis]